MFYFNEGEELNVMLIRWDTSLILNFCLDSLNVIPYTYTTICCSKINTNRISLTRFFGGIIICRSYQCNWYNGKYTYRYTSRNNRTAKIIDACINRANENSR